jgi:hypothetical protein
VNVRPSGRRTERALNAVAYNQPRLQTGEASAANRFSARAAVAPIDHKVRPGRLGFRRRALRIGAGIRFVTIGNGRSRGRLNGGWRNWDDGFDGHGGGHGPLFHCGTVEHRREQKTAADHQPADDDTTFHD